MGHTAFGGWKDGIQWAYYTDLVYHLVLGFHLSHNAYFGREVINQYHQSSSKKRGYDSKGGRRRRITVSIAAAAFTSTLLCNILLLSILCFGLVVEHFCQ